MCEDKFKDVEIEYLNFGEFEDLIKVLKIVDYKFILKDERLVLWVLVVEVLVVRGSLLFSFILGEVVVLKFYVKGFSLNLVVFLFVKVVLLFN